MRYVIIRDDDTNAFTPVDCLERLYRPLLDRGLPVNLATIPDVSTQAKMADGKPEGFLLKRNGATAASMPLVSNGKLVEYLRGNPGYHIVQHGCHHDYLEFACLDPSEVSGRLRHGAELLRDAGFGPCETFVAPYDKLSKASLRQVAGQFRILSTGWFELRNLPCAWWPGYAVKKLRRAPHWHVGQTLLLTHPGCLLSCNRTYSTMLGGITHYLNTQQLTVLVTHWWEYFRNGEPDTALIEFLHETGEYIATHPDLKAIAFSELLGGNIPLN